MEIPVKMQVYLCQSCGKQISAEEEYVVNLTAHPPAPEKRLHVNCAEEDLASKSSRLRFATAAVLLGALLGAVYCVYLPPMSTGQPLTAREKGTLLGGPGAIAQALPSHAMGRPERNPMIGSVLGSKGSASVSSGGPTPLPVPSTPAVQEKHASLIDEQQREIERQRQQIQLLKASGATDQERFLNQLANKAIREDFAGPYSQLQEIA
jgi:hypothetical protein